ncbi:MAG: NAD-dependent epimerase/dehydratase family protein [Methanobrevibacter sp.]|nr:NAD-dependent epimerase/dehydratase family protein [Methanobrevibacter sp.]
MKKALVTGGAGFIGFHLAKHLQEHDCEVTIIDDLSRGIADREFNSFLKKANVNFIKEDMTKKSFMSKLDDRYDEIYHLAALNGTKYFYTKPEKVLEVNILTLMNIIEWINNDNCGKFLFTSSSEAYSGTIAEFEGFKNYIPTNEDVPLTVNNVFNPRFSYGGSKLIGELLTINMLNSKEVDYTISRYHNIYGPRMGFEHVIPEFCERIYNKIDPFPIYGGYETRTFCYISDCVKATTLVMDSEKTNGEIVNIGADENELKIVDVAKALFNIANLDTELDIQEGLVGSVKRRCPNITKLKSLTNYKPDVSFEEGLACTYDWYMKAFEEMDKTS